jgi:hypothetical protein
MAPVVDHQNAGASGGSAEDYHSRSFVGGSRIPCNFFGAGSAISYYDQKISGELARSTCRS